MDERLKQLYGFAEKRNIFFVNMTFSPSKKAMCARHRGLDAIVLDKAHIASDVEEVCLLSEEIGHLETGAMYTLRDYNNPNYRTNILKAEAKSLRWAVKHLISEEDLESARQNGCAEVWQIAEFLNLPESYVRQAMRCYNAPER